jgi:hypothetical protein
VEIPFRSQFNSIHWAFVMTFDAQDIRGIYDGDVSCLNFQVQFKRPIPDATQAKEVYPVLMNLYGKLYRMNQPQDHGAELQPLVDLPISFIYPETKYSTYLSFRISRHYLQQLEDYRAAQQTQDMLLQAYLWGIVAVMKSRPEAEPVSHSLPNRSGEVIRFEQVHTDTVNPQIRIARSDWIDRILPGLGYRQSVLVELPLVRTPPLPEMYKYAAESLEKARNAFEHEDYRAALKYAREVLEHLGKMSSNGSGKLTDFCKEYLEPYVGETKSNAVDRSLNALRDVVNAASHADPQKPFPVDRAITTYVIETLSLNLRYFAIALA